ncbi:DUF397 domain-containing protein [Thermopolyspora sp. NPDC052614]|uniref:DUF397 domain-containing protein n=1 Tax=Thermopolyspora sp. NPDC052614 TaxID=3155682 RepID=UPI00341949AA
MGPADLTHLNWRKSSRSGGDGGDCLEVTSLRDVIAVRDSKNPAGPMLFFSTAEWRTFLDSVRSGG